MRPALLLGLFPLLAACYVSGAVLTDDDDIDFPDDDDSADDDDTSGDDDTSTDDDDTADDDDTTPPPVDADGDGYNELTDCDDADPDIHPGSALQVDGQDSNCDGLKDWLVQVYISGDDDFEWCLDDENAMVPGDVSWPTGQLYEVWMTTGPHVVGIRGWDLAQVITAMIAHIEMSDGTIWVSDGAWKFDPSPEADADSRGGWCAVGFDDAEWQFANVIGPIGTSPWGNAPSIFPAGSPAMWIWDYYPVNLNTQYLRLQIELP